LRIFLPILFPIIQRRHGDFHLRQGACCPKGRAGFRACRLRSFPTSRTKADSLTRKPGTGKSPEPADRNVCPTSEAEIDLGNTPRGYGGTSRRVSSRHDAPPWNCAPAPAARTAPGNGSGQINVPASLTNIIAAGSDGRIRALFLKCMLGLGSLATGKSPNPQAGKPALRSVDILVREFRGLSSPQFKNSVELHPIRFRISGLNSRLQFPGKSTRWRSGINRKVIMKLAWLVKLVVGAGRVPYRGVARCWHAPKARGDAAREAN
jgi:hypothetical protein